MTYRLGRTIVLATLLSAAALAQTTDEYRVKAAFLFNFAKFVEWPAAAFKTPTDPIVIGVLGKDPFGDALLAVTAGKTLAGRGFQVRDVASVEQASGCQILFISSSEKKHLSGVLEQVHATGVLTVGDADNFAAEGGIINFKIEGGTVRLQINMEAARRQQLRISAKLLSLAEIYGK